MYGSGILKTLAMAFRHFLMTYVEDIRGWFRQSGHIDIDRAPDPAGPQGRYCSLPFFVIDAGTEQLRCTACGICAQICPVQCIWIERAKDPDTGRPLRYPLTYYVDTTLCMSCGYCAEFCPFDAVKMGQEFDAASYGRPGFVSARQLAKPESLR
jgi:NADH-quinone oxidoreductase subunit I